MGEAVPLRAPTAEEYSRLCMACAMPFEFKLCDLRDPEGLAELVTGGKSQVEAARLAAVSMADPNGAPRITLIGPPGVGKTVLGTAIYRELVSTLSFREVGVCGDDDEPAASTWLDAGEVGRAAARSRREPDVVRKAVRAPVLLLDDVGCEAIHGSAATAAIAWIVRQRHNRGDRTIYTTGLDLTELAALYGAGISRRLFDRAAIISWKGQGT